jgi:hypothetical protein
MPDGCLWWLLALADYWQHSADDHLVAELFVPAMRVVSAFERELARNGLVGQCDRREWRTQLYPEGRFTCDCDVPLNLLLKMALDAAGGLARALGRKTEADRWARLGTRLRDALRSKAFDAEHQLFIDVVPDPGCRDLAFSEFTNALAVLSGVAEDPTALMQRALAEEAVLPPLSPLHASSIVEALFTAGQDEAATNALRDYWGEMMARDATTFWEYFDLDTPRCAIPLSPEDPFLVAHCRGWSVGPAALLARNLLGVRPAQPGFAAVEVAPSPGGLDAAEGTVQTPQGPVEVKWMREGGRIAVDVALPRELPLTVSLPAAAEGVAVRVGEQTVLSRDGQQTLPAHVRACERMNGRVRLQLESTRGGRFEAEA